MSFSQQTRPHTPEGLHRWLRRRNRPASDSSSGNRSAISALDHSSPAPIACDHPNSIITSKSASVTRKNNTSSEGILNYTNLAHERVQTIEQFESYIGVYYYVVSYSSYSMHISNVQAIGKRIPFADAFPVSYEDHTETEHAFVRIETDQGLVGYGEGTALPWFTGETTTGMVGTIENWIAPKIRNKPIGEAIASFETFVSQFPENPGAKAAVELALLDLRGKQIGAPVRDLLGPTVRSELPLVYPIPGVSSERAAELLEVGLERGFSRFKIKATGDIDSDVSRIQTILGELPEGSTARVDANTGWRNYTTTMKVLSRIGRADRLEYLEQPTTADRPKDLKRIWEESGIETYADEFVHSTTDIVTLGEQGLTAGCHLKIAKTGSLTRMSMMARLANEYDLAVTPVSALGTSLESTAICHLAATVPKLSSACELDPGLLDEDPVINPLPIEPTVSIPDGPGLGIELDDKLFT